ncbi:hypothetical protein D3C72_1706210 [compost metagenome]
MCSTPWSVSAWITISAPVIFSAIYQPFLILMAPEGLSFNAASPARRKKGNKKGPVWDLFSAHQHSRGVLPHVADAPAYYENECPHGTSP